MLVRFCFLLVALSEVVHAQTATVETISADFTARFISQDGSAIGGTSTDHTAVESVIGTYHYYHHYPAVWVDGQVHRLHLPDLYTPNEVYEEVRTDVVAVTANAEIIYGNARQTGAEPGGNPARPGVVRWDGVGGAMTFLEGLPESSTMYTASRDGSVVIGSLPRISTDPFRVFRWEDGGYVELDGIDSPTHYVSPRGVNDEGRVYGTRQSMSAPHHTEAVWWDVDGRLTIGQDLGPESVAGMSGDGESLIVNAQLNAQQTDVVSPGKILRGEEVIETGGALFAPTGGITHSGGSDSPPGSQVSYDGSMMYTRFVDSNSRYNHQLWVEGAGAAPIHDVLAERYGVILPDCQTTLGAGVSGVLSSDGRVVTVKCSESPSPERDQPTYRVTLPATARWADATDGFFDADDRWAPALVPDSLVAVQLNAAGGSPYTITLREDHAVGSLTASFTDGGFDLNGHHLTIGNGPATATVLRVGTEEAASIGFDRGSSTVHGGMTVGEGGNGTGEFILARGHRLQLEGSLDIGVEATDELGGSLVIASGTIQAAGGLRVGIGEGASGYIEAYSNASVQVTAEPETGQSVIGMAGIGTYAADGAFASFVGGLSLGEGATGLGTVELTNSAFLLTTEDLKVAGEGVGEINVSSGSTLSTGGEGLVGVGDEGTGVGIVRVDGAGSRWDVLGDVLGVGFLSTGGVAITNGGLVCVRGDLLVGHFGVVSSPDPLRVLQNTDCVNTPSRTATRHADGGGITAARLTVEVGGEVDVPSIEIGEGGVVDGAGELTIPVTNGGTLAPGGEGTLGTLALTAPLTQTTAGTLVIDIGASSTDALTVDGTVTLGGTLRLAALSGEAPTVGQRYDVLTASSITGAFDHIEAPDGLVVSVSATAVTVTVASAVDAEAGPVSALSLHAPSPNPSRGSVELAYELAEAGPVRLSVHDALGREVAVLVNGLRPLGAHAGRLDASALAPGVYVVRLVAGSKLATQRLTVVR